MKNLIVFLLFFSPSLYGQQVEQYSFGLLYDGVRNPAAIGTSGSLKAIGIVRQQWVGMAGAPSSQYGMVDLPLGAISGGVGVSFQQSLLGAHKVQRLKLGYSYHKTIAENSFVAVGATGGMLLVNYDGTKLRAPEGEYGGGQLNHRDALLSEASFGGNTYTIDVGVYSHLHNFRVGVSVINALAGKIQIDQLSYLPERHVFGHVDYLFELGNFIQIKSGVQVYANKSIVQGQAMILGTWNEVYSFGASLRGISKESIGGIAGIRLNDHFQLFYSYEYNILPLRTVFDSSHEVAIIYALNKQIGSGRLPKVIYNPRYF